MKLINELQKRGYILEVEDRNIKYKKINTDIDEYENNLDLLLELKRYKNKAVNHLLCPCMHYKKIIAVDIETSATNPQDGKIVMLAYHDGKSSVVVRDPYEVKDILEDENVLKVFHNSPFDVHWLEHNGINVKPYTDTMIMSQVANGRLRKENSLADVAHKYLNIVLNKEMQDISNWNGEITIKHEKYCKRDAEITYRLYFILLKKIEDLELYPVLDREIRALPAVIELRKNGIKFEYSKWHKEILKYEKEKYEIEKEIKLILRNKDLNLNSPKQLVEALVDFGIHVKSSSDEELAKFSENNEVIKLIRKYKKLKKKISSFGDKLKKTIEHDGCIRGKWNLIGADTSRMTCTSPNLQGMPKISKQYFVPRNQDSSFIIADYSQIELRVLAEISCDRLLIDAFNNNEDLHKKTASMILGKSIDDVSNDERSIAKTANFGLIYGMTSYGLQKKIKADYDMDISLSKAELFRSGYFKSYKDVLKYQDKMLKADYIETLGGRYWSKDTVMLENGSIKRYNYPIQGTAAEGLKEALYLLMKNKKKHWLLVAVVHDEIVLEVPTAEIDEAKKMLEKCMIDGMRRFIKKVPIVVDIVSGRKWIK